MDERCRLRGALYGVSIFEHPDMTDHIREGTSALDWLRGLVALHHARGRGQLRSLYLSPRDYSILAADMLSSDSVLVG